MSIAVVPTLAIVTHSSDGFACRPTLLAMMIPVWRFCGIRVHVVTERTRHHREADVALLHVGLSTVPSPSRDVLARYPKVINGSVLDISKRSFSRLLLPAPDSNPGRVIVKTDLNYRGLPELRLRATRLAARLGKEVTVPWLDTYAAHELAKPWRRKRHLAGYQVFPSSTEVPRSVWMNRHLVVERFVPERFGAEYVCRHWFFFGSREAGLVARSTNPIVKLAARKEPLDEPVPESLRQLRRELGFDYGKFDYGVVDGQVVLYDVNRTPGTGPNRRPLLPVVEALAAGLTDFL